MKKERWCCREDVDQMTTEMELLEMVTFKKTFILGLLFMGKKHVLGTIFPLKSHLF